MLRGGGGNKISWSMFYAIHQRLVWAHANTIAILDTSARNSTFYGGLPNGAKVTKVSQILQFWKAATMLFLQNARLIQSILFVLYYYEDTMDGGFGDVSQLAESLELEVETLLVVCMDESIKP